MARTVGLRILTELVDAAGLDPCTMDSDEWPGPLSLTRWKVKREETIVVAAAASDQAFTFTAGLLLILLSDEPFALRLAAGETLLENLRAFVVCGADEDTSSISTSVLLSGNGDNETIVKALLIEMP
jgi:hypothetical protein